MLTKEEIRKNLAENVYWEPEGDITSEEWELFDETYEEMEKKGELGKGNQDDKDEDNDDDGDKDDDNLWDDDSDDDDEDSY